MFAMILDEYLGEKPIIIYDTREKKSFVVRHLKNFEEIVPVERTLEIADYLVQTEKGTIAVERKRASDFLSSIVDGRLTNQLENLQEYEDRRLILEGCIFPNLREKACYSLSRLGKSLRKSQAKAQLRVVWATKYNLHPHVLASVFEKLQEARITIIPTGSAYDTAELLRYWASSGKKGEYIAIRKKQKLSKMNEQLFLLAGLPGINTKRAEALLNHFGSPIKAFEAFLTCNPKKFPVKGIGEKTVKEIRKILSKEVEQ